MAQKFWPGDRVRVRNRIGRPNDYPFGFYSCMTNKFEGELVTISYVAELKDFPENFKHARFYNEDHNYYRIKEDGGEYIWHSSMFTSSEALIRPLHENNDPNDVFEIGTCIVFGPFKGHVSPGKRIPGTYFLNLEDAVHSHDINCRKLEEWIPNYRELAKPFNPKTINPSQCCIPIFWSLTDLYKYCMVLVEEMNAILKKKNQKEQSITTPKTLNENEIRFQKPKASSIRGSVPTGRAICGRRCKTAIELGHLSNKACHF